MADKPRIMGILNVTPDSFSDGGEFFDRDRALEHALRMVDEGADIIDVGGESTRPGAQPVSEPEEAQRVLGLIERLRNGLPENVDISIDTTRASLARAAVKAGANMLNDVSAGGDPRMFELAAEGGLPLVLMHMQGTPATMQDDPQYDDVVAEVKGYLLARAAAAQAAGVDPARIIIDPGIGFGKNREHNLQLVAGLSELAASGYPVLLGASRKRFMGKICRVDAYRELVGATCATTAFGVLAGVAIFRVHDVKANRQAADVAWAIRPYASKS